IGVQAKAAVRMRNRPDSALMESVRWFELDPVSHRVPDVMITRTRAMVAGPGDDRAAFCPETIGIRAFARDLLCHVERSDWRRRASFPDCGGSNQKWSIPFKHVYHAAFKRN